MCCVNTLKSRYALRPRRHPPVPLDIVAAFECGFPHQVHDWTPRAGEADRNIYQALARECTLLVPVKSSTPGNTACMYCRQSSSYTTPIYNHRVLDVSSPDITRALKLLSSDTLVHVMGEIGKMVD